VIRSRSFISRSDEDAAESHRIHGSSKERRSKQRERCPTPLSPVVTADGSRRKTPEKNSQELSARRKQPHTPGANPSPPRRQGSRGEEDAAVEPESANSPASRRMGCAEVLSLATMAGREHATTNPPHLCWRVVDVGRCS
jgi:hypothetical protein